MGPEGTPERLAIIVKSDGYEDILLALSFAGIAASAGTTVSMFFTNRGARRLKVGGFDDIEVADSVGTEFIEGAHALGFTDLRAMLTEVKGTGAVRVFLCSRGARIWDIDADSMAPEVDSIMGTATFLLEEARRARTVLTI
jgi:peroxiredoxin family protein